MILQITIAKYDCFRHNAIVHFRFVLANRAREYRKPGNGLPRQPRGFADS